MACWAFFGNIFREYKDGFEHLSALDSDGDKLITKEDPAWGELKIWKDTNTDGISQPSELLSLDDVGLSALPVAGNGITLRAGNARIPLIATATGTENDVLMGDVFLQTAPWESPSL